MRQREKRANKNIIHGASSALSGAGKSVAGAALGGAGAVLGGAGAGGAGHALGITGGHRKSLLADTSAPSTPNLGTPALEKKKKGVLGETVSSLKNLGSRVGIHLDGESSKPEAARSGAGVFGGLMLSTVRSPFVLVGLRGRAS
jgi:hypothetical protein